MPAGIRFMANEDTSGEVSGARLADLEAALRREQKKVDLVQEIGQALSAALDLDSLLGLIMEKVTLLMEGDRSTLYLLSDDGGELWSKVLQGGEVMEIRLRVGEGVAGTVASTGVTLNIPDAYVDARFQPAVDQKSGYRTRSMLCVPMRNSLGAIVGVLQVLNKRGGPFTADDEELLSALASQAAMAIENAKLYHSVVAKNVELVAAQEKLEQKTFELNVLFEVEQQLASALDLDQLLDRILHQAMAVTSAAAGSIALRQADSGELRFTTVAGPATERLLHRTMRMGHGFIGWCAAHNQAVIANDPASDPRHASDVAQDVGFAPRHLLCAPLVAEEVVGVIELVDKVDDGAGFAESDLKLLTLIAGQAAKAIQLARSRVEQSKQDRLASIGRMLAGVLHDLKTPMTIISGYAQLMAQMEDGVQREHYVEHILRQFDIMSGMTREVLAFARGETDILIRKVYLNRFLDEVKTQLEHALAGRNVALSIDAAYSGIAYFDEQKILRVIHNLARNAAEAMPAGGSFRIATRAEAEHFWLEIADSGPGIPADLEGRLFELFVSGKKGGTGLGLAIVKKIVEEHHGDISYESRPGQGTTFHIRLARKRPAGLTDTTSEVPVIQ
jgi:signal transduction histidine kinase/putative methionine-R-sulfoxide reductase with GAF domain